MPKIKPLPDKYRHHVHIALRIMGIDMSQYVLDMICDTYEASRTMRNKFSINELAKIEHTNSSRHNVSYLQTR